MAPEPTSQLIQLGNIASKYLGSYLGKDARDKTFGIRRELDNNYYIGNTVIKFNGDNIVVNDKEYQGTPGLWELVTSKNPDKSLIVESDEKNYAKILIDTNAMKRDYNPNETHARQSGKSEKWVQWVGPIWKEYKEYYILPHSKKTASQPTASKHTSSSQHTTATTSEWADAESEFVEGNGVSTQTIILPSDPNALFEKLDLLLASKKAGNTGVQNEITAIIDELLRQGEIDTERYKKLNLL